MWKMTYHSRHCQAPPKPEALPQVAPPCWARPSNSCNMCFDHLRIIPKPIQLDSTSQLLASCSASMPYSAVFVARPRLHAAGGPGPCDARRRRARAALGRSAAAASDSSRSGPVGTRGGEAVKCRLKGFFGWLTWWDEKAHVEWLIWCWNEPVLFSVV